MNHLKTLFLAGVVLFSSHSVRSQSFPYKTETNSSASNATNGYTLVWQDNFVGTTLDETNNWVVEVNGDGGGNNELQYYRRENISVGTEPVTGKSCMIITGKLESFSGKVCTSGRLKTSGKMSFKHGRIDASIKLPHTANGLWPAFWMMGGDYPLVGWPKCGEIDILEMGNTNGINAGTQDKYYSSHYHWGESWNGGSYPNWGEARTSTYGVQDDFHLYTLIWNDTYLETYLDLDKYPNATPLSHMSINGTDVAGNAAHYFHKQFYVIFNLAIGGNFTGITGNSNIGKITALASGNANMYVDYVKIYQQGVTGEEYTGPALVNTAVNELKVEDQYRIYPNPTVDVVNIEGSTTPVQVIVVNIQGQEIMTVSNTKSINTSMLPSGNYLMRITNENGKVETHQLTKK